MSDQTRGPEGGHYEIRVKGHLGERWSRWFEGMEIRRLPDGETLLTGSVVDQAALQGILARLGDLGLTILLVRRAD